MFCCGHILNNSFAISFHFPPNILEEHNVRNVKANSVLNTRLLALKSRNHVLEAELMKAKIEITGLTEKFSELQLSETTASANGMSSIMCTCASFIFLLYS